VSHEATLLKLSAEGRVPAEKSPQRSTSWWVLLLVLIQINSSQPFPNLKILNCRTGSTSWLLFQGQPSGSSLRHSAVIMEVFTLRLAILVLLTFAFLAWKLRKVGRRPFGMPPGPPTLPILGNLHQVSISSISDILVGFD
jgi:hypothetical protein